MRLDHITIRTRDLATTCAFFQTVFDLEEGPRPARVQRIPGHWLYSESQPLVHLIRSQGDGDDRAAEAIDHVGFKHEGYAAFLERLHRLGLPHSLMDLPDISERRVFLRAPGGPLLEVVFSEPVPERSPFAAQ